MKVTVDDTCTGCGLCPSICPEVFELDDEGMAKVIADPVPADAEDTAKEAAESCPVEAIHVQE